jgi:hypothetical protein
MFFMVKRSVYDSQLINHSDFILMDMKMIMTFPLPLVTIGYDFF